MPPSIFVRSMAHDAAQKKRPSRLVLSNKVAFYGKKKRNADPYTIPGLNRRTANIPERILNSNKERAEKRTDAKANSKSKPPRPMKHMKMQQALAPVARTARNVAQGWIQSLDSFDDFELLPSVQQAIVEEALGSLETVAPTAVQKLAIPTLIGQHTGRRRGEATSRRSGVETYLIAAETGSGKTLAYSVPVIDAIKRQEMEEQELEQQERGENPSSTAAADTDLEIPVVETNALDGKPRAVIIVPTSELVAQVGDVIKSFGHVVKFRTTLVSRDIPPEIIRKRLLGRIVDVVVCTPHLLNSLTETNPALLSRCTHIVVDEADSLFDRSFSPVTTALIGQCANLKKLILCSATIPRSLDTRLRSLYPDMKRLVTPNLHVVPRRVQLQIVDVDNNLYHGDKQLACADTLYTIAKDGTEEGFIKKVIVFVNERETATGLAEYLRSKDIDAVAFTRDSLERKQTEILELFTGAKQDVAPDIAGRQRMKVMVTTDIASRGVDTKTVKNVVLFDKPQSSIDLIHRIGRTGRAGRRGRAVMLVDKRTNKGWVKDIKTTMYMGGPLI